MSAFSGTPRLSLLSRTTAALRAIRAGTPVGDIDPNILATGEAYTYLRQDDGTVLSYAEQVAMAAAHAASRRQSRPPDRYDPSDPSWAPGSGAVQRDGYDGTQMPGRDYDD